MQSYQNIKHKRENRREIHKKTTKGEGIRKKERPHVGAKIKQKTDTVTPKWLLARKEKNNQKIC